MSFRTAAVLVLAAALPALASAAEGTGFVLTEENDLFADKDNNYTQGLEMRTVTRGTGAADVAFGLRSRMYTPADISVPWDQPGDRPWAGVTTAFAERTERTGWGSLLEGVELGVLGPWAGCEWQQTEVHRLIGNRLPQGWSNQVPNEPSLQGYCRWLRDVWAVGAPGSLGADLAGTADFCAGTTYDDAGVGALARAGWNMPPGTPGPIAPKLTRPGFFAYLFAEGEGSYVLHNATLGHSWLRRGGDKWDRDLVPLVGEARVGASFGWSGWSASYFRAWRTDEFEGQPEKYQYGAVTLGFAVPI